MNKLKRFIYNRVTRWASDTPGAARYWPMPVSRTAGERVTTETALTYSAIWRAVTLISDTIATLPWQMRERTVNDRNQVGSRHLFSHPADPLLSISPNSEMNALVFRQALIAHGLTWGNGYAEITRDGASRPAELWIIEPERVKLDRTESGRLVYVVTNGGAADTILEANDMFHLKGPSYDGLIGYSVISYAARSIGLGMATESFGSDFFSNGAFPSIVLEHPGQIGPQAIDNLKNSVADAVSGKNKHAPIVFEEGIKASQWTIPPNDAQFIETRKFQVSEVARWFGVPLHKLQELDKSTFNNIEAQNIEFIQGALLSWIRRLELEANIKLVSSQSRSRVFSKMNMGALLRGDTEARGKYYRELSDLGVFSINDIRELEDMNPIGADGDKRLVQVNRTTIQKVGEDNLQGRIDGSNNNATAPAQVDESENGSTSTKRRAQNKEAESLADLVGAIVSRGTQRVNEALENKKTLSDFAAWLERFDPDQRRYIENKLCDQASSDWVDDYLQALKVKAVDCYNEGAEYSDDVDQVIAELIIR